MSVRENMNQRPWLAATAVILILAGAAYVLYSRLTVDALQTHYSAYYTSDDGKTFFVDDINHIVPFQKGGKEVVNAYVFEANGKQFVGYMSKLNDQAKAAVEKYEADCAAKPHDRPASWAAASAAQATGWLFKKPGDAQWTPNKSKLQLDLRGSDGKPLEPLTP